MLDFLFATSAETTLTPTTAIATILATFILGLFISITYMKTNRNTAQSNGFVLTMIMIPSIIAIIILLVGSNVARAFSLAGAFSIIRFRSAPGEPKDITYIFFTLAAGLACGVGLIGYAILFTVLLCVFMFLLDLLKFGQNKSINKKLKITIPENLNYSEAFKDILSEYTTKFNLVKIKTIDLGTLYELVYDIVLKEDVNEKDFLDLLRCRNGNLSIMLSLAETKGEF